MQRRPPARDVCARFEELFVRVCFEPVCEALVKRRAPVVLPVPEKVQEMLDEILTSIDEGTTDQPTQQSQPYVPNFVLREANLPVPRMLRLRPNS